MSSFQLVNLLSLITSLVEQQKRKLAQLEEIEKEAAEKEPSRYFSLLKVRHLLFMMIKMI